MNPSTALARVLLDALQDQGVRELVLAPGSRSAPLAMAALDAAGRDGARLRLHVRIDERSAGFLALGLARASGRPVAVVTTSGTAVVNLHPAVLEAHHAGVPLVLLTADRPPELRGVGANQTTDQVKIFGSAVRLFHEVGVPRRVTGQVAYWRDLAFRAVVAASGATSRDPGPVHLNLALDSPLVPDGDETWVEPLVPARPVAVTTPEPDLAPYELEPGPRTVVVAGDQAGPSARLLAETAGLPLLAEPSSGARSGPNAVGPYRLLLDRPELGGAVERVVAWGNPTLSRPVSRLLARADVELVVASPRAGWPDPAHNARLVARPGRSRTPLPADGPTTSRGSADAWLHAWTTAGRVAAAAVDEVLDASAVPTGLSVARAVAASLAPGDLLWAGSSSPVRDLDLAARPHDHAGASVQVLANRGLSGIDGAVSSAVGAALALQRDVPGTTAVALLGDLTFLHDANGLVIGPHETRPDLTLVVVNDDGGGLFHLLEQGGPEHAGSFERVFGTPHGVDLGALCAATGTAHARVSTTDELAELLRSPADGLRVLEVAVDRAGRRAQSAGLEAAVAAALDRLAGSAP